MTKIKKNALCAAVIISIVFYLWYLKTVLSNIFGYATLFVILFEFWATLFLLASILTAAIYLFCKMEKLKKRLINLSLLFVSLFWLIHFLRLILYIFIIVFIPSLFQALPLFEFLRLISSDFIFVFGGMFLFFFLFYRRRSGKKPSAWEKTPYIFCLIFAALNLINLAEIIVLLLNGHRINVFYFYSVYYFFASLTAFVNYRCFGTDKGKRILPAANGVFAFVCVVAAATAFVGGDIFSRLPYFVIQLLIAVVFAAISINRGRFKSAEKIYRSLLLIAGLLFYVSFLTLSTNFREGYAVIDFQSMSYINILPDIFTIDQIIIFFKFIFPALPLAMLLSLDKSKECPAEKPPEP